MEVSSLTVKLIILLIPGIIGHFVYRRVTSRANKRSDFMFVIIAIFLGILSYLCVQFIDVIICVFKNICGNNEKFTTIQTFKSISSDNDIPYFEVLFASVFSIAIAYLLAWMDTKNFINKLGIFLKVTEKESDETLYINYLAKSEINVVYIRDVNNNLTYFGRIFSFAEKGDIREIILEDVTVYLYNDGTELYKINSVYLTLSTNVIIEEASKDEQK